MTTFEAEVEATGATRVFVDSVTSAKQPETRARRVERAVTALEAGQKRP